MTFVRRVYEAMGRRVRYYWSLARAKSESRKNLARVEGRNILVVCFGNIYRSPFAATKLKTLLQGSAWSIRSTGFYHKKGRPCAEDFVARAKTLGVDLSRHRSAQISHDDVEWADLIVIMDAKNRELLRGFGPSAEAKVIWIGAWLPESRADVPDPYGRPDPEVTGIVQRLSHATDALGASLKAVSG